MCGIVAAIASRNVVPILIEGLKRLEYRGYDSAGVAVINGRLQRLRSCGRVYRRRSRIFCLCQDGPAIAVGSHAKQGRHASQEHYDGQIV